MAMCTKNTWQMIKGTIPCDKNELNLGVTLKGGQSFRWKEISESKYQGVFASTIWTLHQDASKLFFTAHGSHLKSLSDCKKKLESYFRLNLSLKENLDKWSKSDEYFAKFSSQVKGVRILNQEVTENLFSFICSANNHISRITGMIERMCSHYGERLGEINGEIYFDFPTIEKLAQNEVGEVLSKAGFGYRAKYINNSAKKLMDLGGETWLKDLHRNSGASYEKAREQLIILPGIGRKVADCICLMSLGHLDAIPVDTHIYQVAKETYLPNLKKFSTSSAVYGEVNQHFRNIWGPLAGWAQAVVFCTRIKENKRANKGKEAQEEAEKGSGENKMKKLKKR